jgi:hypothetical protein
MPENAEFSATCKTKFEEMIARRATDFRLDAKLRELCHEDIEEVCGYEKDRTGAWTRSRSKYYFLLLLDLFAASSFERLLLLHAR